MDVYHLGTTKFARQLNGEGAKLHGGRWNLIGTPCIYCSESRALSVLQYAANLRLDEMPSDLSITIYSIPDKSWKQFGESDLPKNWKLKPVPQNVKEWGNMQLTESKWLALKIPSVIIPTEFNFILNPLHPDFKKVKIKGVQSFQFDSRVKS